MVNTEAIGWRFLKPYKPSEKRVRIFLKATGGSEKMYKVEDEEEKKKKDKEEEGEEGDEEEKDEDDEEDEDDAEDDAEDEEEEKEEEGDKEEEDEEEKKKEPRLVPPGMMFVIWNGAQKKAEKDAELSLDLPRFTWRRVDLEIPKNVLIDMDTLGTCEVWGVTPSPPWGESLWLRTEVREGDKVLARATLEGLCFPDTLPPPPPPPPLQQGQPAFKKAIEVDFDEVDLFRELLQDNHPPFVDEELAKRIGYAHPVCSHPYGICKVIEVVTQDVLKWEPWILRRVRAAFTRPIYPGETLELEVYGDIAGYRVWAGSPVAKDPDKPRPVPLDFLVRDVNQRPVMLGGKIFLGPAVSRSEEF